jgi:molecular chaperone DnaJ
MILKINNKMTSPQKLTKDETKILEKLNESENFKPNPSGKEKSFFDRMKEYFHD